MTSQIEESMTSSSEQDAIINFDFLIRNFSRLRRDDFSDDLTIVNAIDPEFALSHPVARQLRGLVVNEKESTIVFRGFPYCEDIFENNTLRINGLNLNFGSIKCFKAHEGSLLRVFNYNDKWFVSTHRKLDAYKSKWSSPESFGQMFDAAIEYAYETTPTLKNLIDTSNLPATSTITQKFLSTLNKDNTYMFLIRNSSYNRLVCKAPENPTIYHVGTYVNKNQLDFKYDVHIQKPEELSFSNVEELLVYVNSIDPYESQGVIIFDGNNTQYKIVNNTYTELFQLRNNEPSIKYRYLQLRKTNQKEKFIQLYSEMSKVFDGVENSIKRIASRIYKMYVDKFIFKTYVYAPKDEYYVMMQCHNWHKQNRDENKIKIEKVIEILETMSPNSIYQMSKRHSSERQSERQQTERPSVNRPNKTINSANANRNNKQRSKGQPKNFRKTPNNTSNSSRTNSRDFKRPIDVNH